MQTRHSCFEYVECGLEHWSVTSKAVDLGRAFCKACMASFFGSEHIKVLLLIPARWGVTSSS